MDIKPSQIRYIKLGRAGRWEKVSLEKNELHFGHGATSHEVALSLDRETIRENRLQLGRSPQAASEDAREIIDFYSLDQNCLWVTLARGHLWWTFAEPKVIWVGGNGQSSGERIRKCIGGWRNADLKGKALELESLSSKLTKVGGYRRTICSIEDEAYVLRRINGIVDPLIVESNKATERLLDALARGIAALDWADFETLIEIVFSRSGWHRTSNLGQNKKLVDILLEHPVTGEHCAVQVKSAASQKVLDEFIQQADESSLFDRLFFVCHSPKGNLAAPPERSDIHVWADKTLAAMVLRLGLTDWVFEKVA